MKVVEVDDDYIYFRTEHGKSTRCVRMDSSIAVGDVLHVSEFDGDQHVEQWPEARWPNDTWIGTVKLKLDNITVVDSGVRFIPIPTTTATPYDIGNTVLVDESSRITCVLSKTAITRFGSDAITDDTIKQFLWEPDSSNKLTFDDFGGLKKVVARARGLIEVSLQHAEEYACIGARPIKGVLFTGQPGTGKTMLARIIASQSEAAFYQISGPEIFSKWYGESESLLRKIFEHAIRQPKAIVFFDEIDSVAAQRDDHSHEASKRVVAQLLTLMDGFASNTNVIVIAATNRPQDLDLALRRPGRFDWEIDFPYPNEQDRLDILTKTSAHLQTEEFLPHQYIANNTHGWSGAELAAIWSEAALLTVADSRTTINEEDYYGGFEQVLLNKNRNQDA